MCWFISPGTASFGALVAFLRDGFSDKGRYEWTEIETVSLFTQNALLLNCPEVSTESASALGRSSDDIKLHFRTYSSFLSTVSSRKDCTLTLPPKWKINQSKKEPYRISYTFQNACLIVKFE